MMIIIIIVFMNYVTIVNRHSIKMLIRTLEPYKFPYIAINLEN